jgi:O-antigen/teichoic acid export membrane protein
LGQYYKADEIAALPSQQLSGLVSKVSLPLLSALQSDLEALKRGFANLVSKTMFISFLVMFNLMAISKSLVLTTMGDKWEEASHYLILLSLGVVFYPLHSLNLNLLQVMGRSDLFLKLEIIKKIMALPIFIIGFFFGVKFLLVAAAVYSFFMLFVNGFWTKKYLQISSLTQIQFLLPSLIFCAAIALFTYSFQVFLNGFESPIILLVQLFSSLLFLVVFGEIFKQSEYIFFKNEAVKLLTVLNPQK